MPSLFASQSEQNLLRPTTSTSPLPPSSHHSSNRQHHLQPQQPTPSPTSSPTTPSAMLKPSRKKYLDITLGLTILAHLLETTLHAVVAIFGIGVGVGLILGDSFRSNIPAVTLTVDGTSRSSTDIAAAMARNTSTTEVESPAFDSHNMPAQ